MLIIYGIGIWLNAYCADRWFRKGRIALAVMAAAMSVFCFLMWAKGVA